MIPLSNTKLLIPARVAMCAALLVLLAACSNPTNYVADTEPGLGHYGYSEVRLDSTTYEVSFAGNYQTTRETCEQYALYRAAELTSADGYDYFVVAHTHRSIERHGRRREPITTKIIRMYRSQTLPSYLNPSQNTDSYNAKEMLSTMSSSIIR